MVEILAIAGILVTLMLKEDYAVEKRIEHIFSTFRVGTKVQNKAGRQGIVIDVNDRNKDAPGCGPWPYPVVKYTDGEIIKHHAEDLRLL